MQMEAGLSFKYRLLCLVVCFGLIFLGAMFYALSTKGSRTCSVSCYVHDFSFMIKVIVCLGPGQIIYFPDIFINMWLHRCINKMSIRTIEIYLAYLLGKLSACATPSCLLLMDCSFRISRKLFPALPEGLAHNMCIQLKSLQESHLLSCRRFVTCGGQWYL